jgi:EpsI family protein
MTRWPWPPALVLVVGALLATAGVRSQRSLPLRRPLAQVVPASFEAYRGSDRVMSDEERNVVGVSDYLLRHFASTDSGVLPAFDLYIGYYQRQASGKTIHSPRNCLPGNGWEPLANQLAIITVPGGTVRVNRYLIQKGRSTALVLYWYQGRGRVASNEFRVKWDLMRDAALRRRSDEALVRIVVPIRSNQDEALRLAESVARTLVPAIYTALPS